MNGIVFIDIETDLEGKILDLGAARDKDDVLQTKRIPEFCAYLSESEYICGHNIVRHDWKYLAPYYERLISAVEGKDDTLHSTSGTSSTPGTSSVSDTPDMPGALGTSSTSDKSQPTDNQYGQSMLIDTLLLSALLFPEWPHHRLLKDDKIIAEQLNNPVNDALKAMELLQDEITAYRSLPTDLRRIYSALLKDEPGFAAFFNFAAPSIPGLRGYGNPVTHVTAETIKDLFKGQVCANCDIRKLMADNPVELAFCLALINAQNDHSVAPRWISWNYSATNQVMKALRGTPCLTGCEYCDDQLDAHRALQRFFGYEQFRTFDGQPLQQEAVEAAINGKSLLAVFPTGGGKSLTFQLPALLAGKNTRTLTVVVSPLLSLMKDQVDNLQAQSINDAVAINGLLDPIERSDAIKRVESGEAHILYIAPESLRSPTIKRLLLTRTIERFVIDEAHCFSAWGQDFRVDYLYIAPFIRGLQRERIDGQKIPVSCFTATAKQDVIDDIRGYFRGELGLELELLRSFASRKNLHYKVLSCMDDTQKYDTLRSLLSSANTPTIIYTSRTRKAEELSLRLTEDGFAAGYYHGKMDKEDKSASQDAFINGGVDIMVATSAFGMGVDKKDVGRVIHYDISDSLENYVQEAGRAGRDEGIQADCYILLNDDDLNKHFLLLNQSKIQIREIQQAWKAIKRATRYRDSLTTSARELARDAGWDETLTEVATRVTTSIAALENAGYVRRDQNAPIVYASSVAVKSMIEAKQRIETSDTLRAYEPDASRIMSYLISRRSSIGINDAQVDVMSDDLGIEKRRLLEVIICLRQDGLLADAQDLIFHLDPDRSLTRGRKLYKEYARLEKFARAEVLRGLRSYNLKELNQKASDTDIPGSSVRRLRSVFNLWATRHLIDLEASGYNRDILTISILVDSDAFSKQMEVCRMTAQAILSYLDEQSPKADGVNLVISMLDLVKACNSNLQQALLFGDNAGIQTLGEKITYADVEAALLFLSRVGALRIEGGFLVLYNRLRITRLEPNPKARYKQIDYKQLEAYYRQRVQMIHIVGEYARKVTEDYEAALTFVDDYFRLEYSQFLQKYFAGDERAQEIKRSLTPRKFKRIFGELSPQQLSIINESKAKLIVVAAGPGSGKTRVLVHKLASLLLMEDVKHEQLLMLTFSRAAATEFKSRLYDLVGNAASFVEVKTFHSYAFDLLGRPGSLEESDSIVRLAAAAIESAHGESDRIAKDRALAGTTDRTENVSIENNRITKAVLVIDEAQDMDEHEYRLVRALMAVNEGLRVIAVGDDDQNIYAFRGSDSRFFKSMAQEEGAVVFELVENYRSTSSLVALANDFLRTIGHRLKQTPIMAVNNDRGRVRLIRHSGKNMLMAATDVATLASLQGTTCMTTHSNDEALRLHSALGNKGLNAKLIQTERSYRLDDLRELRFFLHSLDRDSGDVWIDDDVWQEAKRQLAVTFAGSSDLPLVEELLRAFGSAHQKRKYLSDFKLFIAESSPEDFIDTAGSGLYVSTMHKTKGREFDNVIMVLDGFTAAKDEDKRLLFVAMTRARSNLTIHFNRIACFNHYQGTEPSALPDMTFRVDPVDYPAATEIVLPLGHRDVVLSHFRRHQDKVSAIRAGDDLKLCQDPSGNLSGCLSGCQADASAATKGEIVRFSQDFVRRLRDLLDQGYRPLRCSVNHVLYWHEKERPEDEILIVLPKIELSRCLRR